jgi:hypothetical protein
MNELRIETEYPDFLTFCNDAQEIIYRKMIDVFESLQNDDISLSVIANIEGFKFDTVLNINKARSTQLMDVILPFFEEMEDYKTCDRILKLYNRLQEN